VVVIWSGLVDFVGFVGLLVAARCLVWFGVFYRFSGSFEGLKRMVVGFLEIDRFGVNKWLLECDLANNGLFRGYFWG